MSSAVSDQDSAAAVPERLPGAGQPRLAARIRSGTVNINEGYGAAYASYDAPMGGMKDSGVGRRHGDEGLLRYTEAQTVASQRWFGFEPVLGMPYERYADLIVGGLKLMKRLHIK